MTRQPRANGGFTLIEMLVVIAIIAILAAILFPVFAQAREKARQITCTSNLKQFGLAILQYAQDNDESMPTAYKADVSGRPADQSARERLHKWAFMVEIMPYVKSEAHVQVPRRRRLRADGRESRTPFRRCWRVTAPASPSATYQQVYGSSYKFTHENFLESSARRQHNYRILTKCRQSAAPAAQSPPDGDRIHV